MMTKKVIVLALVPVLMVFGVQGICYSQPTDGTKEYLVNTQSAQDFQTVSTINKVLLSVIWIVTPDNQEATGVLINDIAGLAVTNAHVTSNRARLDVFFPTRDRNGNLIRDREFYLNEKNRASLERLGHMTHGRVIAENFDTDLAIVSLGDLPESVRVIDYKFNKRMYSDMNKDEPVYILGNPRKRPLWWSKAGHFQAYNKDLILVTADAYYGNSGGPVVNKNGEMIGIVSRGNPDMMETYAVTNNSIKDLLDTLKPWRIFSIKNDLSFSVNYLIRWTKDSDWKSYDVEFGARNHMGNYSSLGRGYPKIRFDSDGSYGVAYREMVLETYVQHFGVDVRDRVSRRYDAREYHFEYNYSTRILTLNDSELE